MTINFPSNPDANQIYQEYGVFYEWTGAKWRRLNVLQSPVVSEYTDIIQQDVDSIAIDPTKHNYFKINLDEDASVNILNSSPYSSIIMELNRVYLNFSTYEIGPPAFSVANAQNKAPSGIAFKPDGTRMYVTGDFSLYVYEYSLGTAWDIETAAYVQTFTSSSTWSQGLTFKPDGTKMFICNYFGSNMEEYTLNTPWDISSATRTQVFDIQVSNPQDVTFRPDGTRFYITSSSNERVYQYTLSTAWDISTASYSNDTDDSFFVGSQESTTLGVTFRSDGTQMYVTGSSSDRVHQYTLSTAWDVSTASYGNTTDDSFSVSSQDGSPTGVFFKPDGIQMYVTGENNQRVYQYTLGTPWDVSSAIDQSPAYDNVSFSANSQDTAPFGFYFKPDGTRIYIAGINTNSVYSYTLGTAWDISTMSYDNVSFSVAAQDDRLYDIHFKPDGTRMYISGDTNDSVYSYTLGTAWDISTASYDSVSFSVAAQETSPYGIHFKPDGTKMFMVGIASDQIHQYTLSTAWDISTASYDNVSFGIGNNNPFGIHFLADGTRMYTTNLGDDVNSYTLSTPWDISTASYDNRSFSVSSQDSSTRDIYIKPDGTKMYIIGTNSVRVHQYSMGIFSAPTVTWGSNIQWESGTAPVLDFEYRTNILIHFVTYDGANWIGSPLSTDSRST